MCPYILQAFLVVSISLPPSPLQDSLVLDTPRLRRQVRRYGNDNMEEIVEMNELDEVIKSKAFVKVSFVQKYKCLFLDLL